MKKILAAILLFAMALTLFSCGAKPELVKIDADKVTEISLTARQSADVDEDTFIDLYNKSEVVGAVKKEEKNSKEVIVVIMEGEKDVFTLFYAGNDKFIVTGSLVENEYIIKSAELSKYYNDNAHPAASFISIDGDKVASGSYVAYPDVTVDTAAIVKAYNESKFVGEDTKENGSDTIILLYDDGQTTFVLTHIKDDQFRVSGTKIEVGFIIKSQALADIYADATK